MPVISRAKTSVFGRHTNKHTSKLLTLEAFLLDWNIQCKTNLIYPYIQCSAHDAQYEETSLKLMGKEL